MGVDHEAGSPLPARTSPLPARAPSLPAQTPPPPSLASPGPPGASPLPVRRTGSPDGTPPLPGRTSPLPARTSPAPTWTSPLPGRISPLPGRKSPLPGRASPLPVRTTRTRRIGRHSSPHQLSLPSDAPALVITVPGAATPETEEVVTRIAALASVSCPGAGVRIGYLRGDRNHLREVLDGLRHASAQAPTVVVPLLAFPDPGLRAEIARMVAQAGVPCLVAAPLGPHPLLAEALHVRLAEAGLARSTRVGRISIVTAADGVIVAAGGGEGAAQAAGVVAVLLASRLTIPVASASVTDPVGIGQAVRQLQASRVTQVALAPCVVGPEIAPGMLAAIAAETGVECAQPLGSHPAVAQLVAIRYGAALEDPQLAGRVS